VRAEALVNPAVKGGEGEQRETYPDEGLGFTNLLRTRNESEE